MAIGLERLIELAVPRRNAAWSILHGGKEFGCDHYSAVVSMHALQLIRAENTALGYAGG